MFTLLTKTTLTEADAILEQTSDSCGNDHVTVTSDVLMFHCIMMTTTKHSDSTQPRLS